MLLHELEADKDAAYAHAHRRARWSKGSEASRNMSDGDNATPGLPGRRAVATSAATTNGLPEARGHRQAPRRGSAAAIPTPRTPSRPPQTGNHTDGVTVADLIAKVHGAASVPEELRRPRPEPEPRVPPPAPRRHRPRRSSRRCGADPEDPDTEVIPVVAGYASEVPDLAALRRRDRVQPSRVGRRRSPAQSEATPGPAQKTMVAGRVAAALIAVLGAGADRRRLAVAVVEEQHAQQGLRAGPGLARHPRPQRAVRRRELPDRRRRQPIRREQPTWARATPRTPAARGRTP